MAGFAVDYLDSLSQVPVMERQPQLQQPFYHSLLQVLGPFMQYPQGFTNWEDWPHGDVEAFTTFRFASETALQNRLEVLSVMVASMEIIMQAQFAALQLDINIDHESPFGKDQNIMCFLSFSLHACEESAQQMIAPFSHTGRWKCECACYFFTRSWVFHTLKYVVWYLRYLT